MSEATIYAILAELTTLTTASLRLGLGFFAASLLAFLALWLQPALRHFLACYWMAWMVFTAGLAWLCTSVERLVIRAYLPAENVFVVNGWYWSGVMVLGGGIGLGLQMRNGKCGMRSEKTPSSIPHSALRIPHFWIRTSYLVNRHSSILLALYLLLAILFVFLPPFSRSDKIFSSALLVWPAALTLSVFPWLWFKHYPNMKSILNWFNILWCITFAWGLGVYMLCFHSFLAEMPHDGDFYPFVSLTDWFLVIFVITYLGNIYIQYWLKQSKTILHKVWFGVFAGVALLLLWFNANLFDTLAL